ncbi:MAG TPA: phenylalanine--tRNA ligase subunit beta [Thermodesulfobacteriota bacterium]|nr:phenylalanine--tRNA ligase subunit beta [Thermodesulfobacteriota bacterium]
MLITLNWLKDFIDIKEDPYDLAEILTNAGLEVESVTPLASGLDNIVVAKILKIRAHPDASRLVICDVTDGSTDYNIVCGAKNMKDGDIVALAKIGAKLPKTAKFPDGIKIKKSKIRGEVSEGMLCAENEIGLGEDSEGIMILTDENPSLGSTIVEALGLDDWVFEIGVTPNRPDCLSVLGVARQLSAVVNRKIKYPENSYEVFDIKENSNLRVEIKDEDRCPRYTGRYIDNLEIRKSPWWLRQRLQACGVRAINNVVDITNYVMLEYGHPLHAFDAKFLEGLKVIVRTAKQDEKINTLDKNERELTPDDLLICDASKPIAIAGVMGGENSEVSDSTTSLVLECAYFDPTTVRKTSKRLKLSTESSYRFERGLDPQSIDMVVDRTSYLLSALASGRVNKAIVDVYPKKAKPILINLNTQNLNSAVGINLSNSEIESILNSMDVEIEGSDGNIVNCRVPTYRVDLTREIDLIEDIAIIYGYNSVPFTLPQVSVKSDINTKGNFSSVREIKKFLAGSGFSEVINYSFSDPGALQMFSKKAGIDLVNPLTTEQSCMRTSIIQSVLDNYKRNLNNQAVDIKLFEISRTYEKTKNGMEENLKLCIAASVENDNELWDKRKYDFFDLKNLLINLISFLRLDGRVDLEADASSIIFVHPGKSALIMSDGFEIGYLGYLHPDFLSSLDIDTDVIISEIDLSALLETQKQNVSKFTPIPRFPYTKRDLSLVVDSSISVKRILEEIKKTENELIENVKIFDVYSEGDLAKTGQKSVSISLIIRSKETTLTDEQANLVQSSIFDKLSESLDARMRS